MKISLVKKLGLLIVGSIVILAGLTAYSLYYITRGEIENIEKETLLKVAKEQSYEVEAHLINARRAVMMISANNDLATYLSQDTKEVQGQEILADFKHHNFLNDFLAVYLMDTNGQTLISTDESFVGKNYAFRDYFQRALEGKMGVDVSRGVTSQEIGYYFSNPIKDDRNIVIGVLVGKLDPNVIHNALQLDESNDNLSSMFTDEYGVVIYATDENKLYKSLGVLNDKEKQAIIEKRRFDTLEITSLDYEKLHNFIHGNSKFSVIDIYDSYDREDEVVAIVKLENFPFNLILEEASASFSAIPIRIAKTVSVVVILFSVFMALFVYLLISNLLKPLKVLEESIEKIKLGDLTHRTKITTGDELQDIGEGFNSMAEKLQKNIEGIEKEVHERTKTLEELNKHMIGRELKMVELKRQIKAPNEDDK